MSRGLIANECCGASGPAPRLDDRGVALPLTLLGLVLITLLVTGTLVSSSTEMAIGGAHQDAVRSLYEAESAIEQLLAAEIGNGLAAGAYRVGGHHVAVSLLSRRDRPPTPESAPHSVREGVYSFSARPAPVGSPGRSITLLRRVGTRFIELNTDLDAAVTIGGRMGEMDGDIRISRSASDAACGVVEHAIVLAGTWEVASGEDIPAEDGEDGIHRRDTTPEALLAQALGRSDLGIAALAAFADIRFGWIGGVMHPPFSGMPQAKEEWGQDHPLNWGCPAGLVSGCGTSPHGEHAPVVAIDAGTTGSNSLDGHYGQGMLLVVNSEGPGRFELGGEFSYRGIVLVDGSLRVSGSPRIHGALLVMGELEIDAADFAGGHVDIRYDSCAIHLAERALAASSATAAPATVTGAGWFEVIR